MRAWYGILIGVIASGLAGCAKSPAARKAFIESLGRFRDQTAVQQQMDAQTIPVGHEPGSTSDGPLAPGEPLWIQAGKSRVIEWPRPIRRVSVSNPDVACVTMLGPRTLMIDAKQPKAVQPPHQEMMTGTGGGNTLAGGTYPVGYPLTPEPRVAETSLVIWDGRETAEAHSLFVADFINRQVLLEVTVAELKRDALESYGIDFRTVRQDFISAFFMGGGAGNIVPVIDPLLGPGAPLAALSTSADAPTSVFGLPNDNVSGFIQALQTEGLAAVLAQPRLVAMSGQPAVFQVGGEIPIRIVTANTTDVQYKPFGTLITFVPRVSEEGDIMLTVTPEVSAPDFGNEVDNMPSFRTRRASTSARMRNGQTLVIGGLLQNARSEQQSGVPNLKDIPYLGVLFRRTSYTNETTELVVVVTPKLVTPMNPQQAKTLPLPTDRGPFTRGEVHTQENPNEVTRPRLFSGAVGVD